ncbi:ABC transporter permease [soil metagenome]
MKRLLADNEKTLGVFALVLLVLVVTGMRENAFVQPGNLANMSKWIGLYGILAVGVAFVIITGGIDLSIGSLIGLSGVLLPMLSREQGLPVGVGILVVLSVGAAIGLFHGLLITKLRLQPFLVTLCGLFIYRGIARSVANDESKGFGNTFGGLKEALAGKLFGWLPMPLVILIAISIVAAIFLNKTVWGRYLLALGRNEEAARFSGVEVEKMKIVAYVICSTLAALGGILFVLENNAATPSTFGNFYELYAIAGAVLGGCSLRGGEGAILGVIGGTALVQVSSDAVFFLGVPSTFKFTVIGGFILAGVIIDEFLRRYHERRRAARQ